MSTDATDTNTDLAKLEQERDALKRERDEIAKAYEVSESLRRRADRTGKERIMSDTPETDINAGFAVTDKGLNYTTELYVEIGSDAPFVHANFARKLERERDEARKELNAALSDRDAWARLCGAVDCYTPSTAEPYAALKLQRDDLRAEVERAEAKCSAEYEAHKMTQCERDALRAEVERMNDEVGNQHVKSRRSRKA